MDSGPLVRGEFDRVPGTWGSIRYEIVPTELRTSVFALQSVFLHPTARF